MKFSLPDSVFTFFLNLSWSVILRTHSNMFPSFLPVQIEDVLQLFWDRDSFLSEETLSGMYFSLRVLLGSDFHCGAGIHECGGKRDP